MSGRGKGREGGRGKEGGGSCFLEFQLSILPVNRNKDGEKEERKREALKS